MLPRLYGDHRTSGGLLTFIDAQVPSGLKGSPTEHRSINKDALRPKLMHGVTDKEDDALLVLSGSLLRYTEVRYPAG